MPGVAEAIGALRASGIKIVFATNNATKTIGQYVERLGRFGVEIAAADLVTSAVVTAEEIVQRGWAGRRVFLVGGEGIREALQAIEMQLVEGDDGRTADIVVVSGTPHFDYDAMRTASLALRSGAVFLATNDDPTFPAPDGLWPGAGALLASIETASGRRAEVMGKPHLPMMAAVARRLAGRRRIAVVGDQPRTDLAGARSMGWSTVLVLSGVTDAAAAHEVEPVPDLVVPTLVGLREALLG
ncbi:MAG: HAD-IIA family hydrolase [Actinomycetota bacterium]|nr:HAD-IIA family hydrolase [Actinomycetota bacterium]